MLEMSFGDVFIEIGNGFDQQNMTKENNNFITNSYYLLE